MAGSSLNPIFNVWSKLQQVLAPSVSSSVPSLVPELIELVHEAVYEVYSPSPLDEPELEIVFLHGLQLENTRNAYFTTWMSSDNSQLWLKTWLVAEFPRARILTIAYDSAAKTTHEVGRLDMFCTGENLVQLLTGDSVRIGRTKCPIVLVGHCLGGLVLKELCLSGQWLLARKPKLQDVRNFMSNLKGMFFYGTPHCGALLGEQLDREYFNGPLLEEMDVLKKSVARSNEAFRQLMTQKQYGWMTSGVGELHETFVKCLGRYIHIVPEASTRPYMDDYYSVSGDHYSICKPENKRSPSFQVLCNFLRKVCSEVTTTHRKSHKTTRNELHRMSFWTTHGKFKKHKINEPHQMISRDAPVDLPFLSDHKYVPPLCAVEEVKQALQLEDGDKWSRVVTIHGGPGIGKSSLLKYIALHYQDLRKQENPRILPSSQFIPDGVFYLFCGKGADRKIRQLQGELINCLGFGAGYGAQGELTTYGQEQDGGYMPLPSYKTRLASLLAHHRVLIILDDVWEGKVVEELLVPSLRVKYLVSSQNREIWRDAYMIQLKKPTMEDARKLMANYTMGLPTKGEFPDHIQRVTDDIIKELEHHPLSLANVGLAINREKAIDPQEWDAVKRSLREALDDNEFHGNPIAYERTYPLTVDASMMLMVDSLFQEPQHLLFLVVLLQSGWQGLRGVPEHLVKFFLKFMQQDNPAFYKYRRDSKYLTDRSLLELHGPYSVTGQFNLAVHSLRRHYIRKNKGDKLHSIVAKILTEPNNSSHGRASESGETDLTLLTIFGATYFGDTFRDVVVSKLEKQARMFINQNVIPGSISSDVDLDQILWELQSFGVERPVEGLVPFVSPDEEEGSVWKKQAHHYARKVILRLCLQRKVDDEGIAHLIRLPHTTNVALKIIRTLVDDFGYWRPEFVDENTTFSSAHGEIMKSLLALLDEIDPTSSRVSLLIFVIQTVARILSYESDSTILSVANKWLGFLAEDSNLSLQEGVVSTFGNDDWGRFEGRAMMLVGAFPGILDRLLVLSVEGKEWSLRDAATRAIFKLSKFSSIAAKIPTIPGALEILFKMFFLYLGKDEWDIRDIHWAGLILNKLSLVPENRMRMIAIDGVLDGLSNMLIPHMMEYEEPDPSHMASTQLKGDLSKDLTFVVASILGNLALTKEVRDMVNVNVPEVSTRLHLLLQACSGRDKHGHLCRVMTILNPSCANPFLIVTPRPLDFPLRAFECERYRAQAFWDMRMYVEAIAATNIAILHLQRIFPFDMPQNSYDRPKNYVILDGGPEIYHKNMTLQLRKDLMFLKAMVKDYAGAMMDANHVIVNEFDGKWWWLNSPPWSHEVMGERGILRRLMEGDLVEALVDLDKAIDCDQWDVFGFSRNFSTRHGFLKHRGLVKHLLGDDIGARVDAERAQQLKVSKLAWEETEREEHEVEHSLGLKYLRDLPTSYLGFTL